MPHLSWRTRALPRVTAALVVAVLAALIAATMQPVVDAALCGWTAGALVYLGWTWALLRSFTPEDARRHAKDEDPGRGGTDVALTTASLASVAAVALMIARSEPGPKIAPAVIGLAAIAASWGVIHTLYTVRYAAAYYTDPRGGIDFNEGEDYLPDYHDFAYVAFTLGMTYQISDTDLATRAVRRLVLQHALLSYLFGAVVLAMTINLVSQLAS